MSEQLESMRALDAVSLGARRLLHKLRVPLFLYLCNLIAAGLVIAPLAMFLYPRLAYSLESDRELLNLDPAWIMETIRGVGSGAVRSFGAGAVAVGAVYLLLSTFFTGGALAAFLNPKESFFAASSRHFPRFFRLLLWSVPAYALVFSLSGGIARLIARFAEDSMQEHTWVILGWLRMALILFLLGCVNLTFDYARIILIAENRIGAFRATLDAVHLLRWHPLTTTGIFFTCQGFGILFLLAYHGVTEIIPQNSTATVALVFVIRQLYTIARFWVRTLTWSSEASFYEWLNPTLPEPLPPAPIPPGWRFELPPLPFERPLPPAPEDVET